MGQPARLPYRVRAGSRRGPLQQRRGRAQQTAHGVRARATEAGGPVFHGAAAAARAPVGRRVRLGDVRRSDSGQDVRGARLDDRSLGAAGAVTRLALDPATTFFLRGASEPVILSAEGAKDPLLNETI